MLLEREAILEDVGRPLMVLEKHLFNPEGYGFDLAFQELLGYEEAKSVDKCGWGYFPGMEEDEKVLYPHSVKLADQFEKYFFPSLSKVEERGLEVAFIKAAAGEGNVYFGGFHIDVGTQVETKRDPNIPPEVGIVRFLINLADKPRLLRHSVKTVGQLIESGNQIPLDQYQPIELPDEQASVVEIPGMRGSEVYMLKFWSSLIHHVGLNNKNGFFLVGAGAYLNPNTHTL